MVGEDSCEHRVDESDVFRFKSFSIGWITDECRAFSACQCRIDNGDRRSIRHVPNFEYDVRGNPGNFAVVSSFLDNFRIDVIPLNLVASRRENLALSGFSGIGEKFRIDPIPIFKSKMPSKSRGNVTGNHGSFDRNRSRSASRIDE